MIDVLLVDWLGRGGIAQTTEAWALEIGAAGSATTVVTREGRELGDGPVPVVSSPDGGPAALVHARLCRRAAALIRERRPDVVVVQNYVVPLLEEAVHRAARSVGARLILIVHDHRLHHRGEGSHIGLSHLVRRADTVVAHTAAVADRIDRNDVRVVPHPQPVGMLAHSGESVIAADPSGRLLALQFGVLRKPYKGTALMAELAAIDDSTWVFALAGVGAPEVPAAQSVDRFLDPGDLVATVAGADASILPYHHATQSGAVVLAQMCGAPPIASAVDGIVEQIEDGVTGFLVEPGADVGAWREALRRAEDPAVRERVSRAGREAVEAAHQRFREAALDVVGIGQGSPATTPE
ncbi:glycosyltransferase family 4 protein [Iamia sp. SCSIO 61187]|uniref:glycosyltransferase family 4 protein n=1 Tax=Iamia sp. SCSIO 61187 TaxID=2722752 RepID=UPI001C62E687|nr:glycosyltransferase family 4 protein [Iamia sp. SCSIO 61187]QYG93306.1 glycosyltransferase family 4 protein [Iamia sp. SCSIO 61187]